MSPAHLEIKHTSRRTGVWVHQIDHTFLLNQGRLERFVCILFPFEAFFSFRKGSDDLFYSCEGHFHLLPESLPSERILTEFGFRWNGWFGLHTFLFSNRKRADQPARLQRDLPPLNVSSKRVSALRKVLTQFLPRSSRLQFPDLRTSRKAELSTSLCRSLTSLTCKPVVLPEFQVLTFLIQQHLKGINIINSLFCFTIFMLYYC